MAVKGKKRRNVITLVALIALVVVVIVAIIVGNAIHNAREASADTGKTVVKVGITNTSDEPIWQAVQQQLDADDAKVKLQTVMFSDGEATNRATQAGDVDLNAFQHKAYLASETKAHDFKLADIGNTVIVPLNLYSPKYKSVKELPNGARIAIPYDATNAGRAIKVLESAGLLTTDPAKGYTPSVDDITENPKNIKLDLIDAAQILKQEPEYDAIITNTNYIVDAGKSVKDAIYAVPINLKDQYNKPWINIIVSSSAKKDDPAYAKVVKAYHSKIVADAIQKAYHGAAQPAFNY